MIDVANIQVKAGDGGDGIVSFRREKFVPKGGPDGGDGGKGGDVYLVATTNMSTLMDFRTKPIWKAQSGQAGGPKKMFGFNGEDLVIKLPVGTVVYEGNDVIADLNTDGQRVLIAHGGAGGKGNTKFKSSTNRTPVQYTKGQLGEAREVRLEIKLVADIGIIGFPNAGKTTLINYLTNAVAKVAAYPFTTLTPNLGVVKLKDNSQAILADIPGLIEGASEGKGLGTEFLRHIERTRALIHLIDAADDDIVKSYDSIRGELDQYGQGLTDKPVVVVLNKSDLVDPKELSEKVGNLKSHGIDCLTISAVSGKGIDALVVALTKLVSSTPARRVFEPVAVLKKFTIKNLPNRRMVQDQGEVFEKPLRKV